MNSQCKLRLFRIIKEADQFGAIFKPSIKQGQQEFKTVLGGLISIIIFGLSFAYFIYGINEWATNQILPTITEFNQLIDVIQYQQQQKILQINSAKDPGYLDPFDKKNTILMLMIQQFQQGQPSSNVTRIKQRQGQYIEQNLKLYRNNLNQTEQEYFIFLSSCQQEEEGEKCAEIVTIQQFWNQTNMMETQLFYQKFNPQKRELQKLKTEYFTFYEETSTYYSNFLMQTTISNTDQGLLFPSIKSYEFVSDILQYSQTISIQQYMKLYGLQIYLGFNLRMDIQQTQQNIAYPNISQVLANIGSIISALMLLSHIAIILNNKIFEENAKMQIIKIYYPEIKQISITKTWYGRIVSIRNSKTNESYDIEQFRIYFRRLSDIAQQKLSIKNQIYELSRIQFAIQQLLCKNDILKLRDKHLKLLISPQKSSKEVKVKKSDNDQIQQSNLIQIVPSNDSNIECKVRDNIDLNEEISLFAYMKINLFRITKINMNSYKIIHRNNKNNNKTQMILIYSVKIEMFNSLIDIQNHSINYNNFIYSFLFKLLVDKAIDG